MATRPTSRPTKAFGRLQGYSLLEVLMAVLLLAVLSTVGITQFTNFTKDARNSVTLERMDAIKRSIKGDPRLVSSGQYVSPGYEAQVGSMPQTLDNLVTCAGCTYNVYSKTGWRGPYLSNITGWNQDAWGTAFNYNNATNGNLRSYGPDKTYNTADDLVVSF